MPNDNGLVYERPPVLSREQLEAEFASGDSDRISQALVAAFYTEPPHVVEEWCVRFASHAGTSARRAAATVLGNTAALHGLADFPRAVKVLETLRSDPTICAYAEDALDDVANAKRLRTE